MVLHDLEGQKNTSVVVQELIFVQVASLKEGPHSLEPMGQA